MSDDGSVTRLVEELKAGNGEAAEELWNKYGVSLIRLVGKRLPARYRRVADEEDLAHSAFKSCCLRTMRGDFPGLSDREQLWRLLNAIAISKLAEHFRRMNRSKRDVRKVQGESAFEPIGTSSAVAGLDQLAGDDPEPDVEAIAAELFGLLDDPQLRDVAQMKLEGFTNEEIANYVHCSVPTVERRLRLIRAKWQREVRA